MAIEPAETCAIFINAWVGGRFSIVTSIQIAYLFARLCSVDLASLLVSDLPDEDEYDDDYVPARCVSLPLSTARVCTILFLMLL